MMKNKIFIVFLAVVSMSGCTSNKNIINNHSINGETIDPQILSLTKKSSAYATTYLGWIGDTFVHVQEYSSYILYSRTPRNSNLAYDKYYDLYSRVIMQEGKAFMPNHFQIGVWKIYDKNGRLEKIIDYDEPFTFTLNDVLVYCKNNNIIIPFYQTPESITNLSEIDRRIRNENPIWQILVERDDGLTLIELDGRTGKELRSNKIADKDSFF